MKQLPSQEELTVLVNLAWNAVDRSAAGPCCLGENPGTGTKMYAPWATALVTSMVQTLMMATHGMSFKGQVQEPPEPWKE